MIAGNDEIMQEAAQTIYELTGENSILEQCRARDDYYRTIDRYETLIAEKDVQIIEKDSVIAKKDTVISEKDAQIAELIAENERLKKELHS